MMRLDRPVVEQNLLLPAMQAGLLEAGANEVEPLTHEQNDDIPTELWARDSLRSHGDSRRFRVAFQKWLDGGDE